jgi:glutaredoxin
MRARAASITMLALVTVLVGCSRGRAARDSARSAERDFTQGFVLAFEGATEPEASDHEVVIYGAEWCGPCHQAAAFLARRGVAFVERNVETDRDAAREMRNKLDRAGLGGGGIPVIDVSGRILVGFNARQVDRALVAARITLPPSARRGS